MTFCVSDVFCVVTDAMTRALQESEYLLGELSTMSRQQTPQIAALAKQVEALENSVDIGTKQLDR